MKLIKCPKCGEMYSDSYKTCPFCQEDEALKGRSAAPHRKVTKHRRAPSILGPAMVLVVVLAAVLVGGQSYKIGSRSLTRADLSMLKAMRDDLEAQVAAGTPSHLLDRTFVAYFDGR